MTASTNDKNQSNKSGILFAGLSIVSLIGLAASIYLSQHFYELRTGAAGFRSSCNISAAINCDAVAASKYAELMGGIPLSSFGAGWFLAIFLVSILGRVAEWKEEATRVSVFLTTIGAAFSLYYIGVMAFALHVWCLYCLLGEAASFLCLGIALALKPKSRASLPIQSGFWKTAAGVTLGSLLVVIVLLRAQFDVPIKDEIIQDEVNSVLSTPAVAVNAGTEFPSFGAGAGAKVTIVEFSDFQCPHCKHAAQILHTLTQRYPELVRVVHRNYPLDGSCNPDVKSRFHAAACEAAKVALCAQSQGKFQNTFEALFEAQESLTEGKVAEIGIKAGLDESQLKACMSSQETADRLSKDVREGIQLGIKGTPTIFFNGKRVEAALPLKFWTELVDKRE